MISLVKIISTAFDELKRRIPKFYRNGKDDVQTSMEAAPYGTDANPIKNMVAIYAPTGVKGDTVIIGYINKNQLADVGEHRLYSTDANGVLKTHVWLKNTGVIELGGNTKHLTRFEELETGFNQLKTELNNLVAAYNAHLHPDGTPFSGPTTVPGSLSSASIFAAKADLIKTS